MTTAGGPSCQNLEQLIEDVCLKGGKILPYRTESLHEPEPPGFRKYNPLIQNLQKYPKTASTLQSRFRFVSQAFLDSFYKLSAFVALSRLGDALFDFERACA